jgi:hypothetical protein
MRRRVIHMMMMVMMIEWMIFMSILIAGTVWDGTR